MATKTVSMNEQASALDKEWRDCEAEIERLIAESTEAKIEGLRRRMVKIGIDRQALAAAISRETRKLEPSPRELELTRMIKESVHHEQALAQRVCPAGSLPEKYIRADAVEHFQGKAVAAQAEIDRILREAGSASLGSRARDEVQGLKAIVAEWARIKPLAAMGERIFAEREDRKALAEERNQLEAERRQRIAQL